MSKPLLRSGNRTQRLLKRLYLCEPSSAGVCLYRFGSTHLERKVPKIKGMFVILLLNNASGSRPEFF